MYDTYLFDCGNVLFRFSRERLLDAYVGDNQEDRALIKEAVYTDWHLQDEGVPSLTYLEMVKEKLPERLWKSAENLILHWKEKTWPIEGMKELIEKLKNNGKQLILLSNMPDNFSYDHDDIEPLKHFDALIFSFIVKMAKPNKDIFEYAIKKYDLNPRKCLFIDDSKANIDTAKTVGLNVYHFDPEKPEDFISFVEKNEF